MWSLCGGAELLLAGKWFLNIFFLAFGLGEVGEWGRMGCFFRGTSL